MDKKAAAPKLQENIQTDEELHTFLEKPGLLVLDIYSEWCGPCLGMVGSLKKLKLELGGDNLSYAICKADSIEAFKRFRRKSEPTWLFVTKRKAVNIMFGSNVPKLLAMISFELRLLHLKIRNFYDLSEYQPVELERLKIKQDAIKRALTLEFEKKERERLNYLNKVTDIIMDNLTDMGVTIFGPQVSRGLIKKIFQKADQLKIQCKERKTVTISKEHFKNIHFDCRNPISDEILEQLEGKELFICYWKVLGVGVEVPKILQQFANELQMEYTQPRLDEIEEELLLPALLEPLEVKVEVGIEDDDIWPYKSEEKLLTPQRSSKSHELELAYEVDEEEQEENIEEEDNFPIIDFDLDSDSKEHDEQSLDEEVEIFEVVPKKKTRTKKVRIPPVWVPSNQRTHAALIYTYFRNQTVTFLPPDPQPEPPYVIMAFDAYKKKDLILHAERYRDEVPLYGFFTSDDADEAKYITNSLNKYKAMTTNDKIVLKVKRATSHAMLQLVSYGPSYVSPNPLVGHDEVLKFFPTSYKTAEQEAEEEAKILKDRSNEKLANIKKKQKIRTTHETQEGRRNSVKLSIAQDIEAKENYKPIDSNRAFDGPNMLNEIPAEAA